MIPTAYTVRPRGKLVGVPMDLQIKDRRLALDHPLVMGIVNVTPDSFFDGGRFYDPQQAVAHAVQLVEEGADLMDIGPESTRPWALSVDED